MQYVKLSLCQDEQVALVARRGLVIEDQAACTDVLAASNYYRSRATPGTSGRLPAMATMNSGQA